MSGFEAKRALGRTGLSVGRLGVSGGYGAPAAAFEMAFERGCNYFYHGTLRRGGMNEALKTLVRQGKRDELVVVAQSYSRFGFYLRRSLEKFLAFSGLDHVDVLLLGMYQSSPSRRVLETCARLREKGLFRFLAVSGHRRKAFPGFAGLGLYDIFHIRYNAAHRGAETEIFPNLPREGRPGIVIFTATRWGSLLNSKRTPPGVPVPSASDCYRFVLTHPDVDLCMTGPKSLEQMKANLAALEKDPMPEDELAWMRKVGDHVHR